MTTLRSALLTLALLVLLVLSSLVRNAPDGPVALAAPVQQVTGPLYFSAAAAQGDDFARARLLPSAVSNRRFADRGATLRSQMGVNTINPVASASILPDHAARRVISLAMAQAQAPAVAHARELPLATVLHMIDRHTERFTFSGETQVNLAMLNRALDDLKQPQ